MEATQDDDKMKFLPKKIKWISPYGISSNSYRPVLVATHKHSVHDWQIFFGYVQPVSGYTDYEIMVGTTNSSSDRKISRSEILALGIFEDYGEVK